MKNTIRILLLSIICMAAKCEKKESENCHAKINFSNYSGKNLRVIDEHLHPIHFPNPFDINRIYAVKPEQYKIKSGELNNRAALSGFRCYEMDFNRKDGFLDTLFVYVFDASVVENTPWDVVARDYLVLKRYDLTLEDLQQLDWTITYPPDERMKDIKQYPPYEE